jgi:hypothetical protein
LEAQVAQCSQLLPQKKKEEQHFDGLFLIFQVKYEPKLS